MLIEWHNNKETSLKTFALIPDDWEGKDLAEHPQDEEVFYWLTKEEWIALGAGETYSDFDVVSCGCSECLDYLQESEGSPTNE